MFAWLGKPDLKLVSDEGAVLSTYKVVLGTFSASLRHLITDIGMDHSDEPLCLIFQGQSEDNLKEIVQSAKERFKINIEAQKEDLIIRQEENSPKVESNVGIATQIIEDSVNWSEKSLTEGECDIDVPDDMDTVIVYQDDECSVNTNIEARDSHENTEMSEKSETILEDVTAQNHRENVFEEENEHVMDSEEGKQENTAKEEGTEQDYWERKIEKHSLPYEIHEKLPIQLKIEDIEKEFKILKKLRKCKYCQYTSTYLDIIMRHIKEKHLGIIINYICKKNTRPGVKHVLGVLEWSYIVAQKITFCGNRFVFLVLADPPTPPLVWRTNFFPS